MTERPEPTVGPWRVVRLPNGSVNVYGGADGKQFVCQVGHGETARADAALIVALRNVDTRKDQ